MAPDISTAAGNLGTAGHCDARVAAAGQSLEGYHGNFLGAADGRAGSGVAADVDAAAATGTAHLVREGAGTCIDADKLQLARVICQVGGNYVYLVAVFVNSYSKCGVDIFAAARRAQAVVSAAGSKAYAAKAAQHCRDRGCGDKKFFHY